MDDFYDTDVGVQTSDILVLPSTSMVRLLVRKLFVKASLLTEIARRRSYDTTKTYEN